jgi:hypothetical protein
VAFKLFVEYEDLLFDFSLSYLDHHQSHHYFLILLQITYIEECFSAISLLNAAEEEVQGITQNLKFFLLVYWILSSLPLAEYDELYYLIIVGKIDAWVEKAANQ